MDAAAVTFEASRCCPAPYFPWTTFWLAWQGDPAGCLPEPASPGGPAVGRRRRGGPHRYLNQKMSRAPAERASRLRREPGISPTGKFPNRRSKQDPPAWRSTPWLAAKQTGGVPCGAAAGRSFCHCSQIGKPRRRFGRFCPWPPAGLAPSGACRADTALLRPFMTHAVSRCSPGEAPCWWRLDGRRMAASLPRHSIYAAAAGNFLPGHAFLPFEQRREK